MAKIEIYSLTVCPWCVNAKRLLDSKGIEYKEILIDRDMENGRAELAALTGGESSVPQIFINGEHIGGYDELVALNKNGTLDALPKDGSKDGHDEDGPHPA